MILADTTIWIDHFRGGNERLRRLLLECNIVIHPLIVAELALGSLKDRARTLALLDFLPHVSVVQTGELRAMLEKRSLYSRGIGLVDAHLIASCLVDGSARIWTRDQRLRAVADSLSIAADLG